MVTWFPLSKTKDTFETHVPVWFDYQTAKSETRRYVVGERKPHYPVPALVPETNAATYDGYWGAVPKAKRFFHCYATDGGINWTWALFAYEHDARGFDHWCGRNGLETRGVYPPHRGQGFGVRYR